MFLTQYTSNYLELSEYIKIDFSKFFSVINLYYK